MDNLPIAAIVMPTIDEEQNLAILIPAIFNLQTHITNYSLHLIIIDSSSTMNTKTLVSSIQNKHPFLHYFHFNQLGLGNAYLYGFQQALHLKASVVFQMDGDFQHSPSQIPKMLTLLQKGADVVIGSRLMAGAAIKNFSLYRRFLSVFGNYLIRFLGGLYSVADCTSGYRCIKASILAKCSFGFLSTSGYAFQSSLLCELMRHTSNVIETPITFDVRQFGQSKLRFKDQWEFLLNIPKIRFQQHREWIKFCLVGGTGVVVNLASYIFFTRYFEMSAYLGSALAIELSILSNFLLNDIWTFGQSSNKNYFFKRLCMFHIVSALGGLLNYGLFYLFMSFLHLSDILSQFLGIFGGVLVNYNLNALYTWKKIR